MVEKTAEDSKKEKSKVWILVLVLGIILVGIVVGIILIVSSNDSAKNLGKNISYSEDPEAFCQVNPEHTLCSGEEIDYWDDPVNYCLKNPDDENCEKTGDVDFCVNNPSSVLCDDNADNDYDWVDEYISSMFESSTDSELTNAASEKLSGIFTDLMACINNAGFHIDSFDAFEALNDEDTLKNNYNVAQINKINTCGTDFNTKLSEFSSVE